jgi:sortase (surface protein transpeptidase)
MDGSTGHGHAGVARRAWLPLVLALAGMLALAIARTAASDPPAPAEAGRAEVRSSSPAVVAPRPRTAAGTDDRVSGPHLPSSAPVAIRIPALGVSTPLTRLGLADDGTLEAPAAGDEVGWFTGSATPGTLGPAVIAGHVTWGGPAVFYELGTLDRSDRVLVRREDGRTAVFAVTSVRRYPKASFPTRAVYGATDHAALRLITCGGRFDASLDRYEDNVVVFGRLVAARS